MKKKTIGLIVSLWLGSFAAAWPAEAQQATHMPRIGYLTSVSFAANAARIEAFREGLRALGYVEGQNIVMAYRYAEGKFDWLPDLAAELVRLPVDIIVSGGPAVTRAVKAATKTIPIVMAFDNDPVGSGFVASLGRPGGNITGLSALAPELSGKQLELLKQIMPKLSRVAVLGHSLEPGNAQNLQEVERAAKAFGVQLHHLDVVHPKDIESAFRAASEGQAEAALMLQSPLLYAQPTQFAALAVTHRLPAVYNDAKFVEQHEGLLSYGVSFLDLYRRAAMYVDKILQGAKAADLPVQQPVKFDLVINLKTATALGIKIPPTVLFQATKVIQ